MVQMAQLKAHTAEPSSHDGGTLGKVYLRNRRKCDKAKEKQGDNPADTEVREEGLTPGIRKVIPLE